MNTADRWRPSGTIQALRTRATLLAAARSFFSARNVLEVETPILCANGITDTWVESFHIAKANLWLRTSPEYHMKRLLASGSGDIYQIGKAFRAGESGSRHQPEFTLVEWYRTGFTLDEMLKETCQFIIELSSYGAKPLAGFDTLYYSEIFQDLTGLNPLSASTRELRDCARKLPSWDDSLLHHLGAEKSGWLDLIASHAVYPALPSGRLQVIRDYPAEQALLARLNPDDPATAERFEVFLNGVELANGFRELLDADEQLERFKADNVQRGECSLPLVQPDEHLIAALREGLPDCSGVAVGLDRVLMTTDAHARIDDTVSFTVDLNSGY